VIEELLIQDNVNLIPGGKRNSIFRNLSLGKISIKFSRLTIITQFQQAKNITKISMISINQQLCNNIYFLEKKN